MDVEKSKELAKAKYVYQATFITYNIHKILLLSTRTFD